MSLGHWQLKTRIIKAAGEKTWMETKSRHDGITYMADAAGAAIAVLGLYAIIFVGPVVLVTVAIVRIVKNRREEKIRRLG